MTVQELLDTFSAIENKNMEVFIFSKTCHDEVGYHSNIKYISLGSLVSIGFSGEIQITELDLSRDKNSTVVVLKTETI